ncbi:MAG: hypothetical protein IT445_04070 [Phycisphaeraceae bacterium]|nr:hypothetical protein [Phycisphaeraceae bacterium]
MGHWSWVILALSFAGCRSVPAEAPSNPAPVVAGEYDDVYRAAIDTLRDEGFRVERQDYRFGRISTAALDSPSIVEPWRGHNSTAQQTLASTLDQLQRQVNVLFDPVPEVEGAYTLRVEVIIERQEQPLRRLTGTATRQRISTLNDVPAEWSRRGVEAGYDLPIGRDAEYEKRLLAMIFARAEAR